MQTKLEKPLSSPIFNLHCIW